MSELTLNIAQTIVNAAIAEARQRQFKPMGIIVVDDSGNPVAFAREDGASMLRFNIARGKAFGAVGMGVSSRALFERAKENPNFFLSLASTANGRFLPQQGAVLIKDAEGHVLGAVGASGGSQTTSSKATRRPACGPCVNNSWPSDSTASWMAPDQAMRACFMRHLPRWSPQRQSQGQKFPPGHQPGRAAVCRRPGSRCRPSAHRPVAAS